jgi:hypoxanthine phosphoribosyltransferase
MSAPQDRRNVALREIHSAEEVQARIDALAERMLRDYAGRSPIFVVIAEGARRFAGELVKRLAAQNVRPEVVFLRASRTRGSNLVPVQVEPVNPSRFKGREVLIVDDVADEGRTLEAVASLVWGGEPRTLRAAVLVRKDPERQLEIAIDYVGFELKEGWVVGVGMDLDDRFRELDYLAVAKGSL